MSEPPLSILYVDDESILLDIINEYLTQQGFIVDFAKSGIQALQKIKDTEFDVIVSEYQMPGMNGIELLKEIRRNKPDTPVIIFTGRGSEEGVIDAIENGADFYIRKGEKPVSQWSELTDKIRKAVQQRRESRTLRESEWKFRALVEYSLDGTLILDPRGTIRFVNNAAVQILDIQNPSGLVGKRNVMEFITPESIDDVIRDFDTVAGGVDGYIAQYKVLTEKHEERWVESIGKTIQYEDSPSILISLRDVTAQKLVEESLRFTQEKYTKAFVSSPNAIIISELETGKFIEINDSAIIIFGFTREKLIGTTAEDLGLFPERDQYHHMISLLRDQKALSGYKISCRNASGEMRLCQISSRIIMMRGSPHILSFIEDITESSAAKSAFEALVRSMVGTTGINALRKIIENISSWLKADCVMLGEIQPDKKSVQVLSMLLDGKEISDFSYPLKGTPCEDVAEKGFCLYPDNAALLFPESHDLRELNIRGYIGTPLRNSEGQVFGILCALFRDPIKPPHSVQEIMDIIAVKAAAEIERTRIEQTLHKNQQILAEAMNLANLVSWEYDVNKDVFTFNEQFYSLYGTTVEREGGYQMTSETYARKFIYPEDIHIVAEEVENAIHTTDPDFLSQQEHRIIRGDGEIRYVTVRLRVTKDAQGRTIKTHGVNQDITTRRKSEEAIRKANRQLNLLTSITRHDILNNISVVYAYLDLAKQKVEDPELLEYLREMITAAEEIQSQIEFTRVYEELGSHEPQWVSLDIVMPRSFLPDSITLMTDVPDMYLYADPMVQKVFFALLDNSVRHGQWVTCIRVSAIESENHLTVVWEDNGTGIAPEEKETIFGLDLTSLNFFLFCF
ncbi:MAG: hypothetical protein CVV33_04635 [Methanomicrobiales archaeon HGW-Methanomicrobiales-4]|nr:MAG: hypothetical protein CVV33_04635 [Methanomicrobiales archaeon HGW-Methanomicrobiales-4]